MDPRYLPPQQPPDQPERQFRPLNRQDPRATWTRGPEIIAMEEHILTLADGLVSWMRDAPKSDRDARAWTSFFASPSNRSPSAPNPGGSLLDDGTISPGRKLVLEKMDPDANKIFADLLRAAWHRRCWQVHYGERTTVNHEEGE